MRVVNRPDKSGHEAGQRLGRYLDDRFTLAHHVSLPGRKDAVDGVLVGPHGVTVLAFADDQGRVRCLGDNWYVWDSRFQDFVGARSSPIKLAQSDRKAVEMFLAAREMSNVIPVDCAVLIPFPGAQVEFMDAPVPIVRANKIAEFAGELARQREMLEWTQADAILKSLGVPPLGRPWHTLSRSSARRRTTRRRRPGGLKRWQVIFLAAIAMMDLLVLIGGIFVVFLR